MIIGTKLSFGQLTFQERLGTLSNDAATSVIALPDNKLMLSGSYGLGIPDAAFLIKIDLDGNILWSKNYLIDSTKLTTRFTKLSNGNFLFCGDNYSVQQPHLTIFECDSSGNIIWNKTYSFNRKIFGESIRQTKDAGFIIPFLYDTANYSSSPTTYGLMKTDSVGNVLWCKSYQPDSLHLNVVTIEQMDDNGYLFLGNNTDFNVISLVDFAIKLDSYGNIINASQFDILSIPYNPTILQINSNAYLISSYGSIYLFDSSANLLWQKQFDQQVDIRTAVKINNNRIFLGGYTYDSTGTDALLIEIDSTGLIYNSERYGNQFYDYCLSMCISADSGICLAGYTGSRNANDREVFLVKTDLNGLSGCYEYPVSLTSTPYSNVPSTITMIVSNLTPIVGSDSIYTSSALFTQNLLCTTTISVWDKQISESDFQVFPNPTTGEFYIKNNSKMRNCTIEITNVFGEIVFNAKYMNVNEVSLNPTLSPGLYFIRLQNDEYNLVKQLIIE